MKAYRLARVAEVVREVASETILFKLKDPRIKGVTVTRAEVSADLQHAKVYVSLMGTPSEQKRCLQGLQRAAGYIQSHLAPRLRSRTIPEITFIVDEGVKKSIQMSKILREEQEQAAQRTAAGAEPDRPPAAAEPPAPPTPAEAPNA